MQVEKFYCKVVDDLETELAGLDPTVPMRSVLEDQDEREADASPEGYNTPWVMRGMHGIHSGRDESFAAPLRRWVSSSEFHVESVAICAV